MRSLVLDVDALVHARRPGLVPEIEALIAYDEDEEVWLAVEQAPDEEEPACPSTREVPPPVDLSPLLASRGVISFGKQGEPC